MRANLPSFQPGLSALSRSLPLLGRMSVYRNSLYFSSPQGTDSSFLNSLEEYETSYEATVNCISALLSILEADTIQNSICVEISHSGFAAVAVAKRMQYAHQVPTDQLTGPATWAVAQRAVHFGATRRQLFVSLFQDSALGFGLPFNESLPVSANTLMIELSE